MLDRLGKSLKGAIQKLARSTHVDQEAIRELVRDIQRALLQADVNVQLVLDLTKRIEHRALDEKLPPGLDRREHVIRIVYEEISKFLGRGGEIQLTPGHPTVLLMVGLQGSGKTTSAAKLAISYQKKGFRVGVICADTFRPGAYEQLVQLCERAGVKVFGDPKAKDSTKLAKKGMEQFQKENFDLIIVDSAGRHKREEELMEEMKQIAKVVKPDEVMLVIDATMGQQAKEQATAFKAATEIGSILITKLDGTAKGGGALSAVAATNAPIKFIGVGEHVEDLEPFIPERFAARLLGMGDLETLLKKVQEVAGAEEITQADMKALMAGKLTLQDVYQQLEMVSKMGPLDKLLQMIPGMGFSLPEEKMKIGEEKLKKFKIIMQSMSKEEMENPKIINASRIRRIAKGSGTSEADVRELLKQYDLMKKLIKTMGKGRMPKFGPMGKLMKKLPKNFDFKDLH